MYCIWIFSNNFDLNPETSFYYTANISYIFTKRATLMRRSTVPSLPLQLAFPFITIVNYNRKTFIVKDTGKWKYNFSAEKAFFSTRLLRFHFRDKRASKFKRGPIKKSADYSPEIDEMESPAAFKDIKHNEAVGIDFKYNSWRFFFFITYEWVQ